MSSKVLLDADQGWPGPRDLLFFGFAALLFVIPALILPVPLDTDAQGFGYLGLMTKLGGGFNTLAPFVAAGWADRPFAGLPWVETGGIRPVAGLAAEWLMGLLRFEVGVGLRSGDVGFSIDVNRDWWGIL